MRANVFVEGATTLLEPYTPDRPLIGFGQPVARTPAQNQNLSDFYDLLTGIGTPAADLVKQRAMDTAAATQPAAIALARSQYYGALTGLTLEQLVTVDNLVVGGAAPSLGEAQNLKVPSFNRATGDLGITYTPACAGVDNHIEIGRLEDIRHYGYTAQVCAAGTSGSFGFNPGPDSYFFMIVADDGVGTEGSYGRNGATQERPANTKTFNCQLVQDLNNSCTLASTTKAHASESADVGRESQQLAAR